MIKCLFPSPIYYVPLTPKGIKKLNSELLEESLKFSQVDTAGVKWSKKNYCGGYSSYGSIAHLHRVSTTFEDLQKLIDMHVGKYIKYLEMDVSPKRIQMTSCWVNIMPTGTFHTMHIHPLSVISGTYYLKTPKNCSSIKFEDPRMLAFMASPPRKEKARESNRRFIELRPQVGNLLLFESWMRHEVPQNQSNTERISISFNYDWV